MAENSVIMYEPIEQKYCPYCLAEVKHLGEDGILYCSEDCGCLEYEGESEMLTYDEMIAKNQ